VVNRTGRGQTIRSVGRPGSKRVYQVRVVNDGTTLNTIRVRGTWRGAGARLRYLRGGEDVTAQLRRPKGLRVRLAPGQARQLRMVVTVDRRHKRGKRVEAVVRAAWLGDARRVDVVRALVRVRR
jgi:hypothetical protein